MHNTVTMSSEQARLNWRDTVDTAHTGKPVVIERYNKPVVVILNHEAWQAQSERLAKLEQEMRSAIFAQKFAELEASNPPKYTLEEFDALYADDPA